MHKHLSLFLAGVLVVGVPVGAADATPPSGQFAFREFGRAQVADAGSLATPAGTDVVLFEYSLGSGADTGWRSTPGQAVFAVTGGALTVHLADGCAAQQLAAGDATVVGPGRYLVQNTAAEPAVFMGTFLNLASGGPEPLADGPGEAAPAGCPALAGGKAPAGLTVVDVDRGPFSAADTYGASQHASRAAGIEVEAGTDVLGTVYTLEPGFSTGWFQHGPAINIVTQGVLTYYEEHDGQCVISGQWKAGEAFVHNSRHTHMAVNEGSEPVEDVTLSFNVPHGDPKPVFGGQGDLFDFTPGPPASCPTKLR